MSRSPKNETDRGAATARPAAAAFQLAPSWRRDWLPGLALLVMTLIAYERVRHAGFMWDDDRHLTANPVIVGPLGLMDIWTSRAARICPLTLTTFWMEHALWGLNPLPYHVVNVFMHGACAVLLWRVLKSLRVRGAWLGAALWALHPVQAETVAWITELKNTQSCLFYLLAALFFVRWLAAEGGAVPGSRARDYALALASAAMAMASKSSTVVLPVALLLCAWWISGRWRWRTLIALLPVFAMSLASGVLTLWTQRLEGANDPELSRALPERIAAAGNVVWFYLGKLIWPNPLIFIYPRWHVDWTHAATYLPSAAACLALLILWWNREGRIRPVFFSFAYFLVALLPVLGLVDTYFWRYSFVGDHFQYLASIGPLALAAAAITTSLGFPWKGRSVLAPLLCGLLLSVLAALTARECPKYHDTEALWQSTIAENPGAWLAHNNLGMIYEHRGDPEKAISQYEEALRQKGDYAGAHSNLGAILSRMPGRSNEAIAHLQEALRLQPNFAAAHNNLGIVWHNTPGRLNDAVAEFKETLRINPDLAEAHNNLANALRKADLMDDAITEYKEAIRLMPGYADFHFNLAGALLRIPGRENEAAEQLEAFLRIKPENEMARQLLAQIRANLP
jgi:tetratricopeptide (TPR) repeat protein